MTELVWERVRDGYHNGRPVYEYRANSGGRRYHIVWAYNGGGTFGYTAVGDDDGYLTERHGIHWCGTLKFCKAACEKIERRFTDETSEPLATKSSAAAARR